MEQLMKAEDKFAQEKKFLQESASKQFWKYMADHNVLETFQPALTLLYEMPIKPENIHEFLAEFIENGAVDLLKISHLQAELCYKHSELEQLHRDHPDIWIQNTPITEETLTAESGGKIKSSVHILLPRISISKSVAMESLLNSLAARESKDAFAFLPIEEDDFDEIERRLKFRGGHESVMKVFKLDDLEHKVKSVKKMEPGSMGSGVTGSGKVQVKKEADKKQKKGPVVEPQRKGKKPKTSKGQVKVKENDDAPEEAKKSKTFSQESQTSNHDIHPKPPALDPFKSNQSRKISKLISGIPDSVERVAMENVLMMITDHKKIDPWGILFDFNRRNSEREYELELHWYTKIQ